MKAYQLLNKHQKWTRKAFARNNKGEACAEKNESACRFCALAAIRQCYYYDNTASSQIAKLANYVGDLVHRWNDRSDWKTVYKTLKKLDI